MGRVLVVAQAKRIYDFVRDWPVDVYEMVPDPADAVARWDEQPQEWSAVLVEMLPADGPPETTPTGLRVLEHVRAHPEGEETPLIAYVRSDLTSWSAEVVFACIARLVFEAAVLSREDEKAPRGAALLQYLTAQSPDTVCSLSRPDEFRDLRERVIGSLREIQDIRGAAGRPARLRNAPLWFTSLLRKGFAPTATQQYLAAAFLARGWVRERNGRVVPDTPSTNTVRKRTVQTFNTLLPVARQFVDFSDVTWPVLDATNLPPDYWQKDDTDAARRFVGRLDDLFRREETIDLWHQHLPSAEDTEDDA